MSGCRLQLFVDTVIFVNELVSTNKLQIKIVMEPMKESENRSDRTVGKGTRLNSGKVSCPK